MSGAPDPTFILEPIASDADPSNINTIPDAPPGGNFASIQKGFPGITMVSTLSGGLPPWGQDFNGLFKLISEHTFAQEAGQDYLYNSTLASAMGGYKAGARLRMIDGLGAWHNSFDGNTNDPDTGNTRSGWVPLFAYGLTAITVSGSSLTLNANQARFPLIVLSGALTSNFSLLLPSWLYRWQIVNQTTGNFTVTARNVDIPSGANVVIPQGGFGSPTGVYMVPGSGAYPVVAPLSVPIDQAATPLTLIERNNVGDAFARYWNGSSALETPDLTAGGSAAFFVQNKAGDGYLRKISVANAAAAINPSGSNVNGSWLRTGAIQECWRTGIFTTNNNVFTFAQPFASTPALMVFWSKVGTGVAGIAVNNDPRLLVLTASGFTLNTQAQELDTDYIFYRAVGTY